MINTILEPIANYLPENNRYERIWKLAQIDFKKRYYNDKLGLFWALLNPLFSIAVYYFVFKVVMKNDIENYALFLFAGLILWLTFSETTNKGMNIIRQKKYLIENIQFNKVDLFISQVISAFLGLLFNLGAYLLIALLVGIEFGWNIFYAPIILANLFIICMGLSMILCVIKIYLKDVVHAWSILLTLGMWTSGVFFRGQMLLDIVPAALYVNPFVGIIMNFRDVTMYNLPPNLFLLGLNFFIGLLILFLGLFVFKKYSGKAIELL